MLNEKIRKAPSKALEVWDNNPRVYQEWCSHVEKRGAYNTQRNHKTYVGVFTRSFEDLVTTLEQEDIEAFVAKMEKKCSKLMNGAKPQCLASQDLAGCPMLHPETTFCASYRPLDPAGMWAYICSINRFYEWLLEVGRVSRNPCLPVMRDFANRHSALFDERRRKPRRRRIKLDEVRLLVKQSPIHLGIGYAIMAKCFLRCHEQLKLSWDPEHCDIEAGWMDIPKLHPNRILGGKRLGNPRIVLDSELKPWVRRYRIWWEENVARDDEGEPVTQDFTITTFGRPWGANAVQNFNTALQARCVDLGIMTGQEEERWERISSHAFRGFASTWAKDRSVSAMDLMTLRGDLPPGSLIRYDEEQQRLPDLYRRYAPVLGI